MPRASELGRILDLLKQRGKQGVTPAECAEVLGISRATAHRHLESLERSERATRIPVRNGKCGRPTHLYVID